MTNDEAIAKIEAISKDSYASFDSRHQKAGLFNACYRVGIAIRKEDGNFTGEWICGIGASWEEAFVDLEKHEKPKGNKEDKAGDKVSG